MQVFVVFDVNVKNWFIMEDEIKDLVGILAIVNVNVCKWRKKLVDRLVEECSENIDGNKMIYDGTLNDYGKLCNSCTVYIVLLVISFIISINISSVFI